MMSERYLSVLMSLLEMSKGREVKEREMSDAAIRLFSLYVCGR